MVRRHLGHARIARRHAALVNAFLRDVLAPYLNYHRPCHFPVHTTDGKGRTKKTYPFANVSGQSEPYLSPGSQCEGGSWLWWPRAEGKGW